MNEIHNITLHELRNLKITEIMWFYSDTLGFKLSDGQNCTTGNYSEVNKSYVFDPSTKITKIECILDDDEFWFQQINFFHHKQRLVQVGYDDY